MAEIIKLNTRTEATNTEVIKNTLENANIIKIAKLVVMLADDQVSDEDKLYYIQVALRMGYITKEEGAQLFAYRDELVDYFKD